jgi:hypothetical protein
MKTRRSSFASKTMWMHKKGHVLLSYSWAIDRRGNHYMLGLSALTG